MKLTEMLDENSKYLKKSDIDECETVTVKSLKKTNVARDDADPEYKWIMAFDEKTKPLVLNVTNLKRAGKALGEDTADWIGQRIELYVDHDIEYGGEIVGGLRLRGIKRVAASGKPRARTDDDINRELDADRPDL